MSKWPWPERFEQDGALLARLVGRLRNLKRPVNRVRGLGGRQDPLAPREQDGRSEDVVLEVRLGAGASLDVAGLQDFGPATVMLVNRHAMSDTVRGERLAEVP